MVLTIRLEPCESHDSFFSRARREGFGTIVRSAERVDPLRRPPSTRVFEYATRDEREQGEEAISSSVGLKVGCLGGRQTWLCS